MPTVTLDEAQKRLGELVKSLAAEGDIVITDGQKPVARLTSVARQSGQPRFLVSTADELEEKLAEGVQQLDNGDGIPGDVALQELRERAKSRRPQ